MIRAIVTGASSGIGRETAIHLARAGCTVILAARNEGALRSLAKEIGEAAEVMVTDVIDGKQCEDLVNFAWSSPDSYSRVLVNCAGSAAFGSFDEAEWESAEAQMRINLLAPMELCHNALGHMLEAGGGHIVNVLSIAAKHPFAGAAAYCASKAGLYMFGQSVAAEYRSRNIRVTSIVPGSVDTALWDSQGFIPQRADMLRPQAVAECIRDVVLSPPDRSYDEIVLMPPKGIL